MTADVDLIRAQWVRSSYSDGSGGQCVEFAPSFAPSGVVPVRDSKDPNRPALLFATDGWSDFVSALKRGELPA